MPASFNLVTVETGSTLVFNWESNSLPWTMQIRSVLCSQRGMAIHMHLRKVEDTGKVIIVWRQKMIGVEHGQTHEGAGIRWARQILITTC